LRPNPESQILIIEAISLLTFLEENHFNEIASLFNAYVHFKITTTVFRPNGGHAALYPPYMVFFNHITRQRLYSRVTTPHC
jgi:hypothetical protein